MPFEPALSHQGNPVKVKIIKGVMGRVLQITQTLWHLTQNLTILGCIMGLSLPTR